MASSLSSSTCVYVKAEEEDRLGKELTSKCISIEHLLKWTPFPQKVVMTKLVELELAVEELDGPGCPSLQSKLKGKLAHYWQAYSVALSVDRALPKESPTKMEQLSSTSECLVMSKREAAVQVPVSASSSLSSSVQRQPSLDSLLELFCPLKMQSK